MRTRSSLEYTIPRRRNRRRSRQQQEAIPIVDTDPIPMADDRPMAKQLQAPTGGFERGNDEEPHAHIRHFESITNNQRTWDSSVRSKDLEALSVRNQLLSDYDYEIRYHPGKANVVADALSRKEREPLRVQALVMTIVLDLPKQILKAQTEARKPKNIKKEDVRGYIG
ncbi:hypothetical protein Tco_1473639 [Tanacetum coccineum]